MFKNLIVDDLKFGIRQLFENINFSLPVFLILFICLGINGLCFRLIDDIFFNYTSISDPNMVQRIGVAFDGDQRRDLVSMSLYRSFNGCLDERDVISFTISEFPFVYSKTNNQVGQVAKATPSIWRIYDTQPAYGRLFDSDDISRNEEELIVISYSLAEQLFGIARDALGEDIRLNEEYCRIIGVLPKGFKSGVYNIWRPLDLDRDYIDLNVAHQKYGECLIRFADDLSIDKTKSYMAAAELRFMESFPEMGKLFKDHGFRLTNKNYVKTSTYHKWSIEMMVIYLQILSVLLFFVGCFNVVLLTRVYLKNRESEFLIRSALGASDFSILRVVAIEFFVLFIVSMFFGILLKELLESLNVKYGWFPVSNGETDYLLYAFLGGLSSLGFLLCVVLVKRRLFTVALESAMRENAKSVTVNLNSLKFGMISKFCLSAAVVIVSFFVTNNVFRVMNKDFGFSHEDTYVFQIAFPHWKFSDKTIIKKNLMVDIKNKFSSLRNVEGVTYATKFPLVTLVGDNVYLNCTKGSFNEKVDLRNDVRVWSCGVDDDFFEILNVQLVSGRYINTDDAYSDVTEVVISKKMAEQLLYGLDSIGTAIELAGGKKVMVVGIVSNVEHSDVKQFNVNTKDYYVYHNVYDGLESVQWIQCLLKAREQFDYKSVHPRKVISSLDRDMYVGVVHQYSDLLGRQYHNLRVSSKLSLVIMTITLSLLFFGVYCYFSATVKNLEKEICIKKALGCRSIDLVLNYLFVLLKNAVLGCLLGFVIGWYSVRLLSDKLTAVNEYELLPYILSILLVLFGGILFAMIPIMNVLKEDYRLLTMQE